MTLSTHATSSRVLAVGLTTLVLTNACPNAWGADDTTAPNPVSAVKVTADANRIKLDWPSNREKDLRGYLVYRAASPDGVWSRLTESPRKSSDYTDKTAIAGQTAWYRVSAVDKSGNESVPVTTSATRKDKLAPAAPTGVALTQTSAGPSLDWADNSEADLAGYLVGRATSAGGSYTTLTKTPLTTSAFVDDSSKTSLYYRVAAIDTSGNVSAWVKVTAPDTTAPAPVTGMVTRVSSSRIKLDWTSSNEKDRAGYRVYRATSADGPFELLTTTLRTSSDFSDYDAVTGIPYIYRVTVVDKAGNESEPVTVQALRPDGTAPAAPVGLVLSESPAGVVIDWADATDADVVGFRVWRQGPDGIWTQLDPALVTTSTLTDSAAPATGTITYRVAAVDASGNASRVSEANITRTAPIPGANVVVAADGTGDFTTVSAALAAAPADGSAWVIGIRPGTYHEVVTVQRSNVTLMGATDTASDTVISYDNAAGTLKPDGTTYGTSGSATMLIKGSNVSVRNLTVENSYVETGTGAEQAVALKTQGDRLVFENVRLLGDQDTLYADSPAVGATARSYWKNCYVEGDVDFIFGRGTAVFDHCTLHASNRGSATNNGYVTAASTDRSLTYGYLITDSVITSDAPDQTFHLGRPWQPSGDANAIAQVVIRNTELPAAIKSSPWTNMTATFDWHGARFFEYQNTGAGAGVNADRPQLSTAQAAQYTRFTYLAGADGWNPTGELPPADVEAPAAPDSLTAATGDSVIDLDWTANTELDLAGYNVYRSTDATVALTDANRVATDLATPAYKDRGVTNGITYNYVVTAIDRAGNESVASAIAAARPVGSPLPPHDAIVATDGSGDFTSVQAAITAATGTAEKPWVVVLRPGVYRELVSVTKPYVQLVGATGNPADVVITYDNAAGTTNPATGAPYGTGASQSVLVTAKDVTFRDLTVENAFDEASSSLTSKQAVALKVTGDRFAAHNVRLLGNQDTLLVDTPDPSVVSRSYFVNCYIAGDVDFIFGRGTAVFDRTEIRALSRGSSSNNGYITAASTSAQNPHGFLIIDSTVTSDAPAGTFSLGRPWRGWTDGYTRNGIVYNSRGQVSIVNTSLPSAVRTTRPWADMSPNLWTDGRFGEYHNTGEGASVPNPETRPQLTDEQAAGATVQAWLAGSDGWNPVA